MSVERRGEIAVFLTRARPPSRRRLTSCATVEAVLGSLFAEQWLQWAWPVSMTVAKCPPSGDTIVRYLLRHISISSGIAKHRQISANPDFRS
jgi:hypothetical protein